jgi:hypothetical protein
MRIFHYEKLNFIISDRRSIVYIYIWRYKFHIYSLSDNKNPPEAKKKTTKKGIIITIIILAAVVAASFLVYLIP